MCILFIGTKAALEKNADNTVEEFYKIIVSLDTMSDSSDEEDDEEDVEEDRDPSEEVEQCESNDSDEDSNTKSSSAGPSKEKLMDTSVTNRVNL